MKTTIKIEGMSCEHCAAHVTGALKELSGVSSVEVSLKDKNAVVEHADSVGPESLKAAVAEAGYRAL
ncbi:MAG: cation transporter [Treponema sp.]|jgi:copper ion binding protein|nr:cation transporter [Treponema sp.]